MAKNDTHSPNNAREELRDKVLLAALDHVMFDGWSDAALKAAVEDLGLEPGTEKAAFPQGSVEAALHFSDYCDRQMLAAMEVADADKLSHKDKVALALRLRFEAMAPYQEAVRRAMPLLAFPTNAPWALKQTAKTVDAIWRAVGDRSADFSWYTKRASLGAILTAATLYWLDDTSEGHEATYRFIDRRLDDLIRFGKVSGRFKESFRGVPTPDRIFDFFDPRRPGRGPKGPFGRGPRSPFRD